MIIKAHIHLGGYCQKPKAELNEIGVSSGNSVFINTVYLSYEYCLCFPLGDV